MKRLIPKRARIDFQTPDNLKDYFYLTCIVAIGLFVSIFAFVVSASFVYREAIGLFNAEAAGLHSTLSSAVAKEALEFEYLSKALQNVPLKKLKSRLMSSGFSCVQLFNLDHPADTIEFKRGPEACGTKMILWNTLAEQRQDRNYIAEIDAKSIFLSTVIIFDQNHPSRTSPRRVLVAALPMDSLLPKAPGCDILSSFTKPLATDAQVSLSRTLGIDGKSLSVYYWPAQGQLKANMRWPWTIFISGLIVTFLMGTMIYNLIGMNIEVLKEVDKKTEALQNATMEAQNANMTKTRFLANVSHEVRTPLNLILGMADLLLETPMTADQKRYVTTFRRAGSHLLDIINDILEVARIEVHDLPSEPSQVDLIELFEGICDIVSPACRRKRINFDFTMGTSLPRHIRSNPKQIRQILINLINNSMKFTDAGGVNVRADCSSSDQGPRIRLTVQDTGIGIPKDKLDKVYESFYQVDTSSTRSRGGVGLGLHIVKMCVDHLGGQIQVESTLGKGTTFQVQIPVDPISKKSWLEELDLDGVKIGSRIFLHTSNLIQGNFLRECLQEIGLDVTMTTSAIEGIQLFRSREFDCYLLDLIGQDGDIFDLVKRGELTAGQTAKIVVLCPPIHRANDLQDLRGLGIQRVCYTPVKIGQLLQCLRDIQSGRANDISVVDKIVSPPVMVNKSLEPKRLLVAEDDEDNCFLIQAYLKNSPLDLKFVSDGMAALDLVKNSKDRFDLLITDIQMPKMDGLKLIQELRLWERENRLEAMPIVALTADAQKETGEKIKSAGGNDSLTKPIGKAELVSAISRYLAA